MENIVFRSILWLGVFSCAAISGSSEKTYTLECLNHTRVIVDVSSLSSTSTYDDYKQLACQSCAVKHCDDTMLFRGHNKKNDLDRLIFGDLNGLALKHFGSDANGVSYKCPGEENVQKTQCQDRQTLKDCIVLQCGQCKVSNCEVYVGSNKVNSGEVTVARGVYRLETNASTSGKLNGSLETVKTVASSEKNKGIPSKVGTDVINDRYFISKLVKVIIQPGKKAAILKSGTSFYTRDEKGALITLPEVTGHPLSEEEERATEGDMSSNKQAEYREMAVLINAESAGDGYLRYMLYLMITIFVFIFFSKCISCVLCCVICMGMKTKYLDDIKEKCILSPHEMDSSV